MRLIFKYNKGADHKPTESLNIDQIVTPSDFNLLEKKQEE